MINAMHIAGADVTHIHGRSALTTEVTVAGETHGLWFRWKGAPAPCPGDALLLAALPSAMALGTDVIMAEPISAWLRDAISPAQGRLRALCPDLNIVGIEAATWVASAAQSLQPKATGILFDGGVDAFYTFHKHHQEIQQVIYVADHDDQGEIHYRRGKGIKSASCRAADLGRPLLQVDTNLRHFLGRFSTDEPLLSEVMGALLSTQLVKLFVPLSPRARPAIDSVFNGARVDHLIHLTHHGSDVGPQEKMVAIGGDHRILQALQACWDNPQRSYNCGRCRKCTRSVPPARLVELLARESRLQQRQIARLTQVA